MRKSFNTLAALVEHQLGHDPYAGDVFVFIGRQKNRMKALVWDASGFWLCARRQRIPFPRHHRDLLLTEDDHAFLLRIIGPFQGPEVEDLLRRAVHSNKGRHIVATDDDLDLLLAAVDIEANGFLQVESEQAGRELRTPQRGGNAERLRRLARQIEDHLILLFGHLVE